MPDRSARVPSSARVQGVAHPWPRASHQINPVLAAPQIEKCRPTKILNLNLNLTSGSFLKDHLLFLLFTKSAAPGHYCYRQVFA